MDDWWWFKMVLKRIWSVRNEMQLSIQEESFSTLTPCGILAISWVTSMDWGDSCTILKLRDGSTFDIKISKSSVVVS